MYNQTVAQMPIQNLPKESDKKAKIFKLVYKISLLVTQLTIFLMMSLGVIQCFGVSLNIFTVTQFVINSIFINLSAIFIIIGKLAVSIFYVVFEIICLVSLIKSAIRIGKLFNSDNLEDEQKVVTKVEKSCFSTLGMFIVMFCLTNSYQTYQLNVVGIIGAILGILTFTIKELNYYFQAENFSIKTILLKIGNIFLKIFAFITLLCLLMDDYIYQILTSFTVVFSSGVENINIIISAFWKFTLRPFVMCNVIGNVCRLGDAFMVNNRKKPRKKTRACIKLIVGLSVVIILTVVDNSFLATSNATFDFANAISSLGADITMHVFPALLLAIAMLIASKFESEEELLQMSNVNMNANINNIQQNIAPSINPYANQYGQLNQQSYVASQYGQQAQPQYGEVQPQYGEVQPQYEMPNQQSYVAPQYGQPVQSQYTEPVSQVGIAFGKADDEFVIVEAVSEESIQSKTQEHKKAKKYSFEDEE